MKILIALLFITSFSINAKAQTAVKQDTSCSFLKNLRFKNGVDTIVIKATYLDLVQLPPPLVSMEGFYRKQKLSGQIHFKPENCSTEYIVPLKMFRDRDGLLTGGNLGLSVRLTCVVFKKYLHVYGNVPFFIVIKAVPEKPVGSKSTFPDAAPQESCKFLRNLHFKNGADTVIVKAQFGFRYRQDASLILKELDKKGLIKARDLTGAIGFKMDGCSRNFMAPVHFKNQAAADLLDKQPEGCTIYLTCVVFDGYYNYGEPYFIIDKWSFEKPN
jgi:hypothetical protein